MNWFVSILVIRFVLVTAICMHRFHLRRKKRIFLFILKLNSLFLSIIYIFKVLFAIYLPNYWIYLSLSNLYRRKVKKKCTYTHRKMTNLFVEFINFLKKIISIIKECLSSWNWQFSINWYTVLGIGMKSIVIWLNYI